MTADPATHSTSGRRTWSGVAWAVVAALVLAGAGLGLWRAAHRPPAGTLGTSAAAMPGNVTDLQQALANARKSDEISRAANAELQKTLAQRDEEIASLKADAAFYQKFVGASADKRPLSVQGVQMHQQAAVWRFEAMIAQNTNRDADNSGKFTLGLEGMQDGKLRKLAWSDLRQDAGSDGVPYDFKLFQRVSGDIALPPGFAPTRVLTHLQPAGGAAVENSFAWKDVVDAD